MSDFYTRRGDRWWEERYPRWRCPDCDGVNRYLPTFFETCRQCNADHTLDWDAYKMDWDAANEKEDEP